MRFCFVIVLLWVSCFTVASIDHREELKKAQDWANQFQKSYPIHIFNKDEMSLLFLKNRVYKDNEEHRKKRKKLISDFIFNKYNIVLPDIEINSIEFNLFSNPGVASAWQAVKKDRTGYSFCSVYPNAPNKTKKTYHESITGLDHDQAYDSEKGETYENLVLKEEAKVHYLFSLYHEVSHCLDETFILKASQGQVEPSFHDVHKIESFAEVLAYMKLSADYGVDIAKSRMLYRTLYSNKVGTYLKENPQVSFGSQRVMAAGGIYYLIPALLNVYETLSFREFLVETLSVSELYLKAVEVVQESSLSARSLTAIILSIGDSENTIESYKEKAFQYPAFFLKAYSDLLDYVAVTTHWLEMAFLKENTEGLEESKSVLQLPFSKLCQFLLEDDDSGFLNHLDEYRDDNLYMGSLSSEDSKKVFESLTFLTNRLGEYCFASKASSNENFIED